MKRVTRAQVTGGGHDFLAPATDLQFIKSGSTLLDLVLGGGWPLGRVVNIVGDKSTGKTLLAIEAAANFARTYEKGRIWYKEIEGAFSESYAEAVGMPLDRVTFGKKKLDTVEEFFRDLKKQTEWCIEHNRPGLYMVDSLDALSDDKELEKEFGKKDYPRKPAEMSELFRRLTRLIEQSQMCLIIISQVRTNINATFGRKTTRSGGRALDFYASHVIYLAHIGVITKTKNKVKMPIGVTIKAKCDKNKVGLPFRECEFPIKFAYGIDDVESCLEWFKVTDQLDRVDLTAKGFEKLKLDAMDEDDYQAFAKRVRKAARGLWRETQQSFLPKRKKYGNAS